MATVSKNFTACLKFRHLILVALTLISSITMAGERLTLAELRVEKGMARRGPANFIPDEEVESVYHIQNELWVDQIFQEDNEGVLRSVRETVDHWDSKEEYAKNWNLKSTGLYETPDDKSRMNYFQKNVLKYLDKRLAGEMKDAEAGSTMAKVGQVHKALRPSSEVGVSETVKVKFKARVLQGNASMTVVNPYVDYVTTAEMDGTVRMNLSKEIKPIRARTGVDYTVTARTWVIYVDKKITDTISAKLSSAQSDQAMAMSSESDRTVSLHYNLSF